MAPKKIALLCLVLTLPLLLGNAPAPHPYPNFYEDYTYTPFVENVIDAETYTYTTTITNSGDYYIAVGESILKSEERFVKQLYPHFAIVLPAQSYELIFTLDTQYMVSDLSLDLFAYEPYVGDYTATDFKNITREDYPPYGYRYTYEMNFNVPKKDYYYSIITVYDYNGTTYASSNENRLNDQYFYSHHEMDIEDITITDVLLTKGRSRNAYGAFGKILAAFLIIALILGGFSIFLMIAVPIALTVYFVKRRKSREVI